MFATNQLKDMVLEPEKLGTYIWIDCNSSPTGINQRHGDDFPILTIISSDVAQWSRHNLWRLIHRSIDWFLLVTYPIKSQYITLVVYTFPLHPHEMVGQPHKGSHDIPTTAVFIPPLFIVKSHQLLMAKSKIHDHPVKSSCLVKFPWYPHGWCLKPTKNPVIV